ncbi:MAG: 23S rRNA pseudouridine1911/1915/1917 synthase [Flavobacteriales bacterium]|jgi:23S rRNA pseudouridine1911/1915/1917 synthase
MIEHKVEKQDTLLTIVQELIGFSSATKTRKFIKYGNVMVDGKTINIPGIEVKVGQQVVVSDGKKMRTHVKGAPFPFEVLHEDSSIVVFIKPSGLPIRSDNAKQTSVTRKINSWLKNQDTDEDLMVINKIDKRESGILIGIRDITMRTKMETNGWSERLYVVVPKGPKQNEGERTTLFRRNKIGLLLPVSEAEDSIESTIKYRVMRRNAQYALLKITCDNDHKNEVRAQMAAMGHAIIGDKRYKSDLNPMYRLGLHVFSLTFEHPVSGDKMEIKTQVPREFLNIVK